MGFSSISLKWLSVSEAVLLAYTMPLWATLFAWPINGTRPTARGLAAVMLGMLGIAVLLAGRGLALGPDKIVGIVLALSSAILFAIGGVLMKSPLPIPPVSLVAWQVGLGCLPMVVLGVVFEHPNVASLSPTGWTCLIYMALVPMGACYISLFAARRLLPVTTASTGLLIVPVLGVAASVPILGEAFGLRETLALVLTLAGLVLALQKADAR
jgi:drug/metabolite transporter (DMT)-like permease